MFCFDIPRRIAIIGIGPVFVKPVSFDELIVLLSLSQLLLEEKPIFLIARQILFHVLDPSIKNCLTDGLSHKSQS